MTKIKQRPSEVPSQEVLHNYFSYDPDIGILKRSDIPNAKPITGEYLSFEGKLYTTARIIFRYMLSDEMPKQVMRVDGDVRNNKWLNITCKRVIQGNGNTIHLIPSNKKRKKGISKTELPKMFRYDRTENQLYIKSKDGLREHPMQVNKITIRGITYSRTYLINRLTYIAMMTDDGLVLNKTEGSV